MSGLRVAEWHGPFAADVWALLDEVVRDHDLNGFIRRMNVETMRCAQAIPFCVNDAERWLLIEEAAYFATCTTWVQALKRRKKRAPKEADHG